MGLSLTSIKFRPYTAPRDTTSASRSPQTSTGYHLIGLRASLHWLYRLLWYAHRMPGCCLTLCFSLSNGKSGFRIRWKMEGIGANP